MKYECLPGDCANAANLGLPARGQYVGEGDGNGIIEGVAANTPASNSGALLTAGETAMFWVDLSQAGLIEGTVNQASSTTLPSPAPTGAAIGNWLPPAKIGGGNYVYAWSGSEFPGTIGVNYFGISAITILPDQLNGNSLPGLTVAQAHGN